MPRAYPDTQPAIGPTAPARHGRGADDPAAPAAEGQDPGPGMEASAEGGLRSCKVIIAFDRPQATPAVFTAAARRTGAAEAASTLAEGAA